MKLVEVIQKDFPKFSFITGDENLWFPEENKIFYVPNDKVGLLHELSHAVCGHKDFIQDIELIHAERDAWDKAKELGQRYGVKISEKRIEAAMEWYRDWLHNRSTCPECRQNGIQRRKDQHYECLNCGSVWSANDGRNARMHRYITNPPA